MKDLSNLQRHKQNLSAFSDYYCYLPITIYFGQHVQHMLLTLLSKTAHSGLIFKSGQILFTLVKFFMMIIFLAFSSSPLHLVNLMFSSYSPFIDFGCVKLSLVGFCGNYSVWIWAFSVTWSLFQQFCCFDTILSCFTQSFDTTLPIIYVWFSPTILLRWWSHVILFICSQNCKNCCS